MNNYDDLLKIIEENRDGYIDTMEIDVPSAHLINCVIKHFSDENRKRSLNLSPQFLVSTWATALSMVRIYSLNNNIFERAFDFYNRDNYDHLTLSDFKSLVLRSYADESYFNFMKNFYTTLKEKRKKNGIDYPISDDDIDHKFELIKEPLTFNETKQVLWHPREPRISYDISQKTEIEGLEFNVTASYLVTRILDFLPEEKRKNFLKKPIDEILITSWLIIFQLVNLPDASKDDIFKQRSWQLFKIDWSIVAPV